FTPHESRASPMSRSFVAGEDGRCRADGDGVKTEGIPGADGYSARRAEAVRARAAQAAGASAPAAAMTRPDSASRASSPGTYTSSTEAGTPPGGAGPRPVR